MTLGVQRPRVCSIPPSARDSAGKEAVDLARVAGLHLDPWQAFVLEHALGERDDGKWAARRVGVAVPRQNGKGSLLEARELAGLFLLGEEFIVHSAHLFDTSFEAFMRLLSLIEDNPEFMRRVKPNGVKRSHGEEGIHLKSGQRIRFRTRSGGGGRGFSADCVILDEAMYISRGVHSAMLPTISAKENPQVWYTGSAVDQLEHEHGEVFATIREQGLSGHHDGVMYMEWSPPFDEPSKVTPEAMSDPGVWAQANPALGIRIESESIESELQAFGAREFAVERLNVGDWPSLNADQGAVIRVDDWMRLADETSGIDGPVTFAFDVSPDRRHATISAAGRNAEGLVHVETAVSRKGTEWLVPKLVEMCAKHDVTAPICDGRSPAHAFVAVLQAHGLEPVVTSSQEHADACGQLYDLVERGELRHFGTKEMVAAIRAAVKRPLGDAWAWTRTKSPVDITPLVAATLAVGAVESEQPPVEPFVMWG